MRNYIDESQECELLRTWEAMLYLNTGNSEGFIRKKSL